MKCVKMLRIKSIEWLALLFVRSKSKTDEIFVLESRCPIHLTVPRPEGVGKPLDLYTAHDEVVQSHSPSFRIISRNKILGKRLCKPEVNIE